MKKFPYLDDTDGQGQGDAGGKGGDGQGQGDDKGQGGLLDEAAKAAKAAEDKAAAAAAASGVKPRPAEIPEQFWDKAKGEVNTAAALKSYAESQSQVTKLVEENKKLKGASPKAPAKAEDYKFEAPADMKDAIKSDDPGLGVFRKVAHKMGVSQEQFQAGLTEFLTEAKAFMPEPVDTKAEMAKLGPNAQAVMDAVYGWGKGLVSSGLWSDDEFNEVVIMGSTATGLKALNKLRERSGEKPIPLNAALEGDLPSKEELYAAKRDPRYRPGSDKYDPEFKKKIDRQFDQVFGTQPAGSSEAGLGVG